MEVLSNLSYCRAALRLAPRRGAIAAAGALASMLLTPTFLTWKGPSRSSARLRTSDPSYAWRASPCCASGISVSSHRLLHASPERPAWSKTVCW